MTYIGDKIDLQHFGLNSGVSAAPYIVDFLNYILYNLDLNERQGVLVAMIDFSKAVNRVDHNVILT